MASSCFPLGRSRQMKGVFLGTAGGAEPPFTPTARQAGEGAGNLNRLVRLTSEGEERREEHIAPARMLKAAAAAGVCLCPSPALPTHQRSP